MADGFLGRWSRRKLDTEAGRPLAEPPAPPALPPSLQASAVLAEPAAESPAPALPTLADLGPVLPEPHPDWMTRLTAEWQARYTR